MAKEIERKFLVDKDKLKLPSKYTNIKQGYIETKDNTAVRIRIADEQGFLTFKGENKGFVRDEFEYEIPFTDAIYMFDNLCSKRLSKKRYIINHDYNKWEVDVFSNDNEGLVLAEIELSHEHDTFEKPKWLCVEVSNDNQYYNSNLAV
jgi:adenylate cyclase